MSDADPRCICTMAQSLTGDGCRYCQPQEYIDRLHEQIYENESEVKEWLDKFISSQKRLDPEAEKILNDNLWDLYARS